MSLQKTFEQFKDLAMEREALKEKIGRSELASFRDEVECRRSVLKKLGHLDSEGVLTVKGKAAAEVRDCLRTWILDNIMLYRSGLPAHLDT